MLLLAESMKISKMCKKITCGIIFILVVIFSFIYVHKNHIEQKIIPLLHENNIEFNQLSFDILPTPKLQLEEVKLQLNTSKFHFKNIIISTSISSLLLNKKIQLEEIYLQQGEIKNPNFNEVDIVIKPTALYLKDLLGLIKKNSNMKTINNDYLIELKATDQQNNRVKLKIYSTLQPDKIKMKSLDLTIETPQAVFNHLNKLNLKAEKGAIIYSKVNHNINVNFNSIQINHVNFNQIEGNINKDHLQINGDFVIDKNNIKFNYTPINNIISHQNSTLQITANYLDTDKWLSVLELPVILTGKSNLNADLLLKNNIIQQGNVNFNITMGNLKGLNILNIISQGLPINYPQDISQNLDSPFNQLTAKLDWNRESLNISQLLMSNTYFYLKGAGKIQLHNMQCLFKINLYSNDEKYQDITLPITFFDDCYYPKYKVEINKSLRKQIKNLLKEKLQQKQNDTAPIK